MTATQLIIEYKTREIIVKLSRPWGAAELYQLLVGRGARPTMLTLSGNVARASY